MGPESLISEAWGWKWPEEADGLGRAHCGHSQGDLSLGVEDRSAKQWEEGWEGLGIPRERRTSPEKGWEIPGKRVDESRGKAPDLWGVLCLLHGCC